VENHRGVQQFQSARIILAIPEGKLVIDGLDLAIGWVDHHAVLITGQVGQVRIEEGLKP
jgi:sporulation protein YqfC